MNSVSPFCVFQSTPPVKAATASAAQLELERIISIHAAREGGDSGLTDAIRLVQISIHAAREGGDGIRRAR